MNSYSQILRSLTMIGGSSIINVAFGLLRTKVAAMVLGPVGVGYIGVYQSLLGTAAAIFSLGSSIAGTRKIAQAVGGNDDGQLQSVTSALFTGTAILALIGCVTVYIIRVKLSEVIMGTTAHASQIGWLSLGVGITILSGAQLAYLNGLRRIPELAKITIISTLLSTLLAVSAILVLRDQGTILFVVSASIATFACGYCFTRRIRAGAPNQFTAKKVISEWNSLARLGAAFMISGLAGTLAQLAARTLIGRQMGTESVGQFQAAWTIGMTYIGFVLSAMGTDFYPRLASIINDHKASTRLINQQTELVLIVSGPSFLILMAFTPSIVHILYSTAFTDTAYLLRWQILGDILKIVSWPLGFVLLSIGNGRDFMAAEVLVNGIFVFLLWIGLKSLGLPAAALAFVGMYAALLPIVYWVARVKTGFRWETGVALYALGLFLWASISFLLSRWSEWAIMASASTGALVFGAYGLSRLNQMVELPQPLNRIVLRIWPTAWRTGD